MHDIDKFAGFVFFFFSSNLRSSSNRSRWRHIARHNSLLCSGTLNEVQTEWTQDVKAGTNARPAMWFHTPVWMTMLFVRRSMASAVASPVCVPVVEYLYFPETKILRDNHILLFGSKPDSWICCCYFRMELFQKSPNYGIHELLKKCDAHEQ